MPRRSAPSARRLGRPGLSTLGATAVVVAVTVVVAALGAGADGVTGPAPTVPGVSGSPTTSDRATVSAAQRRASRISLGAGLLAFPDAATQWVDAHPDDPRAPQISQALAGTPTALWLTGDESFGNLSEAVRQARAADRTMVLSLYNIPLRYDGLSAPTTNSLRSYQRWIDQVAATIGTTRAIVVLEPDALWFYDRMSSDQDRATRLTALTYAVGTLRKKAPRTRVYLDAGTSSGSVTPDRMATLLLRAGMAKAAGYAVNTSSYAPTASIQAYAQAIRSALRARGIADPRYVTDTGRNGASTWDYDWCNPSGQRLGRSPRAVNSSDGRDLDLWVKAPGTSDGDCGPVGGGQGTYGGEFIPSLAVSMIG